MKSKLEECFNKKERIDLMQYPNVNEFLKESNPVKDSDDWRLTYHNGKQIVVKDRNYSGTGVKIIQIVLTEQGVVNLQNYLKKKEGDKHGG